MRKHITALAALALCAALLAGCTNKNAGGAGSNAASGNTGSSAAISGDSGTAGSSAGQPTPTPAGSAAASGAQTAYSAEGLNTVLSGLLTEQTGTAGGSLKAAAAAGELVNFAAIAGSDSATLGADTKAWLDTLDDAQKETLRTNWQAVRDTAHNIATDLDNQTGLLADAGVQYDFASMDMSGVDAFINTVDSVLGVY